MYGVAQADQRTDTLETKLEEPVTRQELDAQTAKGWGV
jgi:hypothetical protein